MKVYTQLRIEEREMIFDLRRKGASIKVIGQAIHRDKSTIFRELERNKYSEAISYMPDSAHQMAKVRKNKLLPKLDRFIDLRNHVIKKLQEKWSPDVIAGTLKAQSVETRISVEAIYQ